MSWNFQIFHQLNNYGWATEGDNEAKKDNSFERPVELITYQENKKNTKNDLTAGSEYCHLPFAKEIAEIYFHSYKKHKHNQAYFSDDRNGILIGD